MGHLSHSYRDGSRGRSLKSAPGKLTARLACTTCPVVGERNLRQVMPPEQIDAKFRQAGWLLDPNICPACVTLRGKEKTDMTKPSASAIKAQARMFTLLSQHFDGEAGRYAAGWSDAKVAEEADVAADFVAAFRVEAFGEIREPAELTALRSDIGALEQLQREHAAGVAQQIAELRGRVSQVSKALLG